MDATQSPTGLDVDRRILALLCDDARKSFRALARAAGMPPDPVVERVERMERAGVIAGCRAEVNPSMLENALEALVGVELTQHKIGSRVRIGPAAAPGGCQRRAGHRSMGFGSPAPCA